MTRLFLHIGTHKTGTTSIQAALDASNGNFIYPRAGRHPDRGPKAHHMLVGSTIHNAWPNFGFEEPSDALWRELLAEVSGHDLAVVSSEQFCRATEEDIARIRKYLDGIPTTVVIYIRNHWDFAVSWYKQMMKQGYDTSSFRKHTEKLMDRLDYDMLINRWGKRFGLRVRLFDKVKNDLLSDFAEATGIVGLQLEQSRNLSLGDDVLCTLRLLHKCYPGRRGEYPGQHSVMLQRIRQNIISGRTPGRYLSAAAGAIPWIRLISQRHRPWFRQRTEEIRGRFLKNHVDPQDWHLFEF